MSYSNRPSHRADPSVAPVMFDQNGKLRLRQGFETSPLRERQEAHRVEKKKMQKRVKEATRRAGL